MATTAERCPKCLQQREFCLCGIPGVDAPSRQFMKVLGKDAEDIENRMENVLDQDEERNEVLTTLVIPVTIAGAEQWLDYWERYCLQNDDEAAEFIGEWIAGFSNILWLWLNQQEDR